MNLRISGNDMMMFALFKIVCGALTLWQGKVTHKTFRPIMKEYRDAETGITQGIVMDKRHSKRMAKLKKKLLKIVGATAFVMFLSVVYYKSFQDNLTDQWIDQKYDYIEQNNNTEGKAYSVEKMQSEIYNVAQPVVPEIENEEIPLQEEEPLLETKFNPEMAR